MKAFWIILLALALSFSITVDALAGFTAAAPRSDQQRYRWKSPVIRIALSSSLTQPSTNIKTDSDVLGAVRRSLAAWKKVADIELQLVFSDKQSLSPSGPAGDKVNLITIAQTPENVLLFSKAPLSESAKTRVFFNRSGNITEADIVLNPFQQFSTDGTFGTFDLESTLTHEIGHLLGLRHSAVLAATMSDSTARNGSFGLVDLGSRTLAASDIAGIRDLYGPAEDEGQCCGTITGKVTVPAGRTASLQIWAEESGSGRVAAQTEAGSDGTFRIGGLNAGSYELFWQGRDEKGGSSIGELASVQLETGDSIAVNEKVAFSRSGPVLNFVGINSQLTESSVPIAAGRDYVIYVGGRNVRSDEVRVGFSSPYLRLAPGFPIDHDFGQGVSVLSFTVTVDQDAPPGVYSIFAATIDGARSSLIGALNVE